MIGRSDGTRKDGDDVNSLEAETSLSIFYIMLNIGFYRI